MNIVSISLTDKNLKDLESVKQERGLANLSETIRSTINDAVEKIELEQSFEGNQNAVLIVSHFHETEKFVSNTKHKFQQLIKSQNHYCTKGNECIDMFLLQGLADKIKKMKNEFLKNRQIKKIAFTPL